MKKVRAAPLGKIKDLQCYGHWFFRYGLKPTNLKQRCLVCRELILKGAPMISTGNAKYHRPCFIRALDVLFAEQGCSLKTCVENDKYDDVLPQMVMSVLTGERKTTG